MRHFIFAIAALLFLAAPPVWAATGDAGAALEYAAGLDDMPLMPGLRALPDEAVVFDQPDGRFVETLAEGLVSEGAVRDFYTEVLPQLGWVRENGDYMRDGEQLSLQIDATGTQTRVRFTVSPTAD